MATFEVNFETDNSAFSEIENGKGFETARILKEITHKVEDGYTDGKIMDANGNKIGSWGYY